MNEDPGLQRAVAAEVEFETFEIFRTSTMRCLGTPRWYTPTRQKWRKPLIPKGFFLKPQSPALSAKNDVSP